MSDIAEYLCPICKSPLQQLEQSWKCTNNHSFDIAKQGYVNLLPVQYKKSREPGDNKAMIQARRDFLALGHYDFLIEACTTLLKRHTVPGCKLLDVGCGEGYFTDKIFSLLDFEVAYGMDISKEAIKVAAKRNRNVQWMVGSNRDIPLALHSLDAVLKINVPTEVEVLSKYIKPDGIIMSVTPGKNHLDGLKNAIYPEPRLQKPEPMADNHVLIDQQQLEQSLVFSDKNAINNLLLMTPFAWNIPRDIQQKVADLQYLETHLAFQINVWQQKPETLP